MDEKNIEKKYPTKEELHKIWVESKYNKKEMTSSQHSFSLFLLENIKEIDKIGDLLDIFNSVYRFIKFGNYDK